jgi:hypothetical protein
MNRGLEKGIYLESQPTPPAANRIVNLFSIAILIASIVISASFILKESGVVPAQPMDQHFADTINLKISYDQSGWIFHYPSLQNAGGITSSLLAGIYKLLIPTTHENLNWHIRIFAMATYLASSFFLFRTFIANHYARILAFLIIASSGFQFKDRLQGKKLNGFGLCILFLVNALAALGLGSTTKGGWIVLLPLLPAAINYVLLYIFSGSRYFRN